MSVEGISGETAEVDIFEPPAAEVNRYPEMKGVVEKGKAAAGPALVTKHETSTKIDKWQQAIRVVKT